MKNKNIYSVRIIKGILFFLALVVIGIVLFFSYLWLREELQRSVFKDNSLIVQDKENQIQSIELYMNQVYGNIVEITEEKGMLYITLSAVLPQAMSNKIDEEDSMNLDLESLPMEMYVWKFMISNEKIGEIMPENGSKVAIVFYGEPSEEEYVLAEFLLYPEI
ncbi:MAG: hypothetical protein EOM19_00420 [Candidatus Moranbacteria bacterium]|nr:hypothetical protein [Candidatus Moranbacteria bacterium]